MPLEYVDDHTPARWIADRLHPFAQDAGAIIPPGFEAYARIFHPATQRIGREWRSVSWREIAVANGRVHHPEMQFGALVGRLALEQRSQPGLWDGSPKIGSLPLELARALVPVLRPHTSTPESCWFAIWEGWGSWPHAMRARPTFKVPGRGYYLATGALTAALDTNAALGYYQSASLWWPNDRSWCVATEVDFDWTYVGGSNECIRAVLETSELEVLPARLSDGVTEASDPINPAPR